MKFVLHNSSWLDIPDPAEAFEAVKANAVGEAPRLCLVLGHGSHDPDPARRRARRAGPGRLDRPGGAGRRHEPHPSCHPLHGSWLPQSRASRQDRCCRRRVDGDVTEVRHKLAVLRRHCDAAGRDYDTIEKTRTQPWLLARDAVAVAAKRERLAAPGPLRGFVGTVSEAIDLIGEYQDAGVDLLINADRRNDAEPASSSPLMSCLILCDGRFVGAPARGNTIPLDGNVW